MALARTFPLVWGAGIAAALSWPAVAAAQANYDGVNLGGRTAMMGGAGVARGSDGATVFINPAGLARIPGESFTFSTFAVKLGGRSISRQLDPSGELGLLQSDVSNLNVGILPQTFCLFLDGPPNDHYSGRSRHKYGLCAVDTENDAFLFSNNFRQGPAQTESGVSYTTRLKWARSTLALSWALQLFPATAIGVTFRVENSRLEDQTDVTDYGLSGTRAIMQTLTNSRVSSSWDLGVVMGLTHQISRYATLGASLSSPSQHLFGFYQASEAFHTSQGAVSSLVQDVGDFRYNQPGNLRLGLGFAWPKLNFELSASYFGASEDLAVVTFDRSYVRSTGDQLAVKQMSRTSIVERASPVVNFMAGAEAFLARDFSLILGAQTDYSALPVRRDGAPSEVLFRQSKDAFHASIGVATYRAGGSLLLGLRGLYASGEVLTADPARNAPWLVALPQTEWGLSLVVSGQITFEALRDTAVRASPWAPSASERAQEKKKGSEGR